MDAVADGFFMLRRPMFPLDTLYNFNKIVGSAPENFERELISLFSQPLQLEALFTASPGVYYSLQALKEGGLNSGREKLLMTLYKYLVRMCSRATPYGLFAGIASGTLSRSTSIKFAENEPFKKHTRLDMALLAEISSDFQKKGHIRSQTRFFPNTSLYLLDGCYRYVERVQTGDGFQYVLSAVETNVYLEKVLTSCTEGSTIAQLVESLQGEMPPEQASDFVEAVIGVQLLCSELDVNVTGTLYQDRLIERLHALGASQQAAVLEKIKVLTGQHADIGQLLEMQNVTENLVPQLSKYNLVQTDLRFQTESCQIGHSCIEILAKEFEKVQYLLRAQPASSDLDSFRKDFFQKYENREIPLLAALDNESGIGFGALVPGSSDPLPLLEQLSLWQLQENAGADDLRQFKEELFERAITGRTSIVELTDADFANFEKKSPLTTDGFYWLGSLISDSQNSVDKGNFKFVLKAAGGPSGLELMGRFSHADQQLDGYLKESAGRQHNPDYILAEIAHLPEPRTANVLQRTHIREYEIVFLCGSCLPSQYQILPSDLMVSVPDGKAIVLRSRRFNKRVIPRMSTAHNFSQGLPLYRFLCELSNQESAPLQGWDWGPHSGRVFLPRIQYKHWVIARASWNVTRSNYKAIFEKTSNFQAEWGIIRKNLELPRYVQICQGDNELLIDCDNPVSMALLKDVFSKQQSVRLTEFLDSAGAGILHQHGNFFTNELVVPFRTNTSRSPPIAPVISRSVGRHLTRDFTVGGPWLYAKIYMGTKSADQLLSTLIKPFCQALVAGIKIEKWFFIRYQDPLPHIRLRFYNGKESGFWHTVLGSLSEMLSSRIRNGLITRLQTDTYQREVERYQGLEFEQTESIFYADSQAVLDILEIIGRANEQLRWQAGLAGADQLIDDLGFAGARKLELIQAVYTQLLAEFPEHNKLAVQLNNKYRALKKEIHFCLDRGPEGFWKDGQVSKILDRRSEKIYGILQSNPGTVTIGITTAASFVHMFLNRLFISRCREQELVIYHYLHKFYKSMAKLRVTT